MLAALFAVCLIALPAWAQTRLSDKALEQLRATATEVAAVETGQVPELLLKALIAAEDPAHLKRSPETSNLTKQLARLHLGAMPTLQRQAAENALATFLAERLSPSDIARAYAALVYYGRNCFGYRDAAIGLARKTPERAEDAIWLALAALPRSPSFYLRDRAALRDRVETLVTGMKNAGLIDAEEAKRLDSLPLASVDVGVGCSS
jgi:membrane peptidoglycan carboxypeptidase